MRTNIPFTYSWIVRHHLANVKTVLDAGAGNGAFMQDVNYDNKYLVIGIELFDPYIKMARKTGVYQKIGKMDVRKMDFKNKEFDAVHSSQVIEHLKKSEGFKFIRDMQKIAKKTVIIGTPQGHCHQEEYDGNKLQEHLSEWDIHDFEKSGYKVYGQGLKYIYSDHGWLEKTSHIPFFNYILYLVSFLVSPLVYLNPHMAAQLIAVKKL